MVLHFIFRLVDCHCISSTWYFQLDSSLQYMKQTITFLLQNHFKITLKTYINKSIFINCLPYLTSLKFFRETTNYMYACVCVHVCLCVCIWRGGGQEGREKERGREMDVAVLGYFPRDNDLLELGSSYYF